MLAQHFVQSRYCGQCSMDTYGLERTFTDDWHRAYSIPKPRLYKSILLCPHQKKRRSLR